MKEELAQTNANAKVMRSKICELKTSLQGLSSKVLSGNQVKENWERTLFAK